MLIPTRVQLLVALGAWLLTARIASAQSCYATSIVSPVPFMGNNGEIFRLADGSIWEVKYEYEYLYEYNPDVVMCPSRGILVIDGTSLNVEPVAPGVSSLPRRPGTSPRPSAPQLGLQQQLDEFSLYDSNGRATAYLEPSEELTFYIWSGEPVAYLVDAESVFGFNGKHLGWYRNGLVYDHDGDVVVAPASAFRESPSAAPPRSFKRFKPFKGLKELKPLKPLFGRTWSKLPAQVFFLQGRD